MRAKLLINLFLIAIVFGVLLQVFVQTALAPPLQDAMLVGKHLNRYDIQRRGKSGRAGKTRLRSVGLKAGLADSEAETTTNAVDPKHFLKTVADMERDYGTGPNLDHVASRDLYLQLLDDTKQSFNLWLDSHMTDRQEIESRQSSANSKDTRSPMVGAVVETVEQELEHAAVLCSIARSRTRRYIRDRMSDRMGAWALFARDAWKYGGKDLVRAIAGDVRTKAMSLFGMPDSRKKGADKKSQRPTSIPNEAFVGVVPNEEQGTVELISQSGAAIASIGACLSADDDHPCPGFAYMHHVRQKTPKDILNSCFSSNEFYNRWFSSEGIAEAEAEKADD